MDSSIYIVKLKYKEERNRGKSKGGRWIERVKNTLELHERQ